MNTKIVNLVVHDAGSGIGMWSDAVDAEAYGNIIYYNGWMGPDRSHGHGIYTQNKAGVRRIVDNVVFNQFGMGLHVYGSDQAFLDDLHIEGNVVFTNGILRDFNILLGGHRVANRPVVLFNHTYDRSGSGNNVGYQAGCADLTMKGNYFGAVDGGYAIQLVNCTGEFEGNTLAGNVRAIRDQTIVAVNDFKEQYPKNDYVDRPAGMRISVRPNRYTAGRAHVVVYNWDHAASAEVDLGAVGIPPGGTFEVRDVRSLHAGPVVSGTYAGRAVTIPLNGLTAEPIVGWKDTPAHMAPEFAVFLVTSSEAKPSALSAMAARVRGLLGF